MGRVSPFITAADCYLFRQGTHYEIYRKLGAHPTVCRDEAGVYFAVWAPRAISVHVAGSFNDWSIYAHPMTRIADSGIFECFIPGIQPGAQYMYAILTLSGTVVMKADPYGAQAALRPATASVVVDTDGLDDYPWSDQDWISKRTHQDPLRTPYSIYEVHLGSWKRSIDTSFLNYRQLAHELTDYTKQMGYTHVELIGIAEHPFDGSWGYQVTGYYAPTSRHGSPQDFAYLVDHLHSQGIGVILDWVPAHFPKDLHGLADFDGTPTYEYADPAHRDHPHWGTRIFDYRRPQVTNFLIANALYWAEQYHVDGLRVDAVSSMLYRDYGKDYDQSACDTFSGKKNTEAIAMLRRLNTIMKKRHPGVVMIAEESTAWPQVTSSVGLTCIPDRSPTYTPNTTEDHDSGLGFTFKWNMGWMHDFLDYLKVHPMLRGQCHHRLTFGMTYAFSENFILTLSHDEVVHLKRSLLSKMPGTLPEQIANLKVGYAFMMGHPGKKLLFMGQDFGQLREWDETRSLDWHLLQDANHRALRDFTRDLLHLYRNTPAMYEDDRGWDGFQWIQCDDAARSIFSFIRTSRDDRDCLLFVCNFSPMAHPDYRVGVPGPGRYQLILDENGMCSADRSSSHQSAALFAEPVPSDGLPHSITHPLSAYGIQVYHFDYPRN